ncbi:MAG TPA: transglycosylase domain-containing protein, partial [Aggregatilineales bacterium]|nr:transglycosylase domain-containing protein [Aggregatilineales bacterium]
MVSLPPNPTDTPDSGGWYTPPDAVTPTPPPNPYPTTPVPLPTDAEPPRPGGWYVPLEATSRVSELILQESAAETPSADSKPTPEATAAMDYSNYVAGVGFVSAEEAARLRGELPPQPIREVAVATQPPAPAGEDKGNVEGDAPLENIPMSNMSNSSEFQEKPAPEGVTRLEASVPIQATPPTQAMSQESVPASPPAASSPSLAEKYEAAENAVRKARRRYAAGMITRDQLNTELRNHMVLDDQKRYWVLGVESDKWFRHDGTAWVADTPPGYQPKGDPDLMLYKEAAGAGKPKAFGTSDVSMTQRTVAEAPLNLPKKVAIQDSGATVVGNRAWASRLESESRSASSGATVASAPLSTGGAGVTVVSTPAATGAGMTVPSAAVGSTSPGVVRVPAAGGGSKLIPGSIQPDYGDAPSGFMQDPQKVGGCLVTVGVLSIFGVLIMGILGSLGSLLFYTNITNQYTAKIDDLPNAINLTSQSVRFLDTAGKVLYQLDDPKLGARTQVPLDQMSPYLLHAVISAEEPDFYTAPGFDVIAIIRAIIQNVTAGAPTLGDSTITQQVAKLRLLDLPTSSQVDTERKIEEVITSAEIARRYTKSQILEFYLNTVYFGNLAYGAEAAAQIYFKKSARDLNLSEASFLAGLIESPAAYDPVANANTGRTPAGIVRAQNVREMMIQKGCVAFEHIAAKCITREEVRKAVKESADMEAAMATYKARGIDIKYPHAVFFARQELERLFGSNALYTAGFSVYLTLDTRLQDAAESTVKNGVNSLALQNVTNGAALVLRPSDGAVLAMVGSADFFSTKIEGQVNVVTQAARQPGTALQPFLYLGALERDSLGRYWTPATPLFDVKSCFGANDAFCPANADGRFRGPVNLRYALGNGYNVPAVKAFEYVGLDRFKALAARLGIAFIGTQPEQAAFSTGMGTTEVTMLSLANAYMTLGNGGRALDPYIIARVTLKKDGVEEIVYQPAAPTPQQAVEPGLAYLITSILSDNAARTAALGGNSALNLQNGHIAAVKMGTSDQNRDSWTFGYTPGAMVAVWMGNNNNSSMSAVAGSTAASLLWNQIMTSALAGVAPSQAAMPTTVAQTSVCDDFGTADHPQCRTRRTELYFTANPPPSIGEIIGTYEVDTYSGLIANEYCPDFKEARTALNILDRWAITWMNTDPTGSRWATERGLRLPVGQRPASACQPGQV